MGTCSSEITTIKISLNNSKKIEVIRTACKKPSLPFQNQNIKEDTYEAFPVVDPFENSINRLQNYNDNQSIEEERCCDIFNDRRSEGDINIWPYCTIGLVYNKDNCYFGTGTLIGPKIVLTCAHNIIDIIERTEGKNLVFKLGCNGNSTKMEVKVVKTYYPKEYMKGNKYEDYGICILEREVDSLFGYIGLCNNENVNFEKDYFLYGFPGEKNKTLWGMTGQRLKVSYENVIEYDSIDTSHGQSGSAIFFKEKEKEAEYVSIVGIHVRGNSERKQNEAVYINERRFAQIHSWIMDSKLKLDAKSNNLSLDLVRNQITIRGVEFLTKQSNIAAEKVSKLNSINLDTNELMNEGFQELCRGNFPNLKCLNVSNNKITDKGLSDFYLFRANKLKNLCLDGNKFTATGIKGLVSDKEKLKFLKTLSLKNCLEGENVLLELSYGTLPSLEILDLSNNRLSTRELKSLSKHNFYNLEVLDLESNSIDKDGIIVLENLKLNKLKRLSLKSNNIGKEGVENFSKCQNFKNLTHLNLDSSSISDKGIVALKSCKFSSLYELDIGNNRIEDNGVKELKEICFNSLYRLILSGNGITNDSFDNLSNLKIKNLIEVKLDYNKISKNDIMEFEGKMKSNYSKLCTISLRLNDINLNDEDKKKFEFIKFD